MISAFGVDHGEISKGRVPFSGKGSSRLIPKTKTKKFNGAEVEHRGPSRFLNEKLTHSPKKGPKETVGGGLTTQGKVAAGSAAGLGGAGVVGGSYAAGRRNR